MSFPRQPVDFFSVRRSKVFTLHTSHFTLHSFNSKLETSHSTLHTSHFALHSPHFTLLTSHCLLHTPNLTLHTSHFTLRASHSKLKLHTPHFTLLTSPLLPSHCTLHTALFTPHTSHCSKPTCNKKTLAPKWRKSANKFAFRSLHAASPRRCTRYTRSSCKRHYACSQSKKQPWRSHSNAICGDWVAKHKRTTRNGIGNCSSKTGSRRQSEKKTILKHFLKGFLEGKSLAPKWRKSADKSLSQPSCSHSNTIYEVQLQKTIVLRMQPKHEATLTQPFQCDLRRLSCKTQ